MHTHASLISFIHSRVLHTFALTSYRHVFHIFFLSLSLCCLSASLYLYMYVYICILYVCMYVCMYIYINTYIHILGVCGEVQANGKFSSLVWPGRNSREVQNGCFDAKGADVLHVLLCVCVCCVCLWGGGEGGVKRERERERREREGGSKKDRK